MDFSTCSLLLLVLVNGVGASGASGTYIHIDTPMAWQEAQDYCLKIKSTGLASIHSREENEIALATMFGVYTDKNGKFPKRSRDHGWSVHIGFTDKSHESEWGWSDGSRVIFKNWARGEPNNYQNEDCGALLHNGYWNDEDCTVKATFLCNDPLNNQRHFKEVMVHKDSYMFIPTQLTFDEAENECKKIGSSGLAVISSPAEQARAHMVIMEQEAKFKGPAWLGLRQPSKREDVWVWQDGNFSLSIPGTYLNWNIGEPNDFGGKEDCASMNTDGMWNDLRCSTKRAALCNPISTCPTCAPTSDLFISGYAEGSGRNRYLEFYNPTNHALNLSDYGIAYVINGPNREPGAFDNFVSFTGDTVIRPHTGFLMCDAYSHFIIKEFCSAKWEYLSNGNDGFQLVRGNRQNHTVLDAIGDFNTPKYWSVCGTALGTKDHTLVRKKMRLPFRRLG